ncbi:MAG: hypothetical protein HYY76_10925 [Acidobacteria bacterium]|nr:hypothetical protein [Acidobacteriota bacterium]
MRALRRRQLLERFDERQAVAREPLAEVDRFQHGPELRELLVHVLVAQVQVARGGQEAFDIGAGRVRPDRVDLTAEVVESEGKLRVACRFRCQRPRRSVLDRYTAPSENSVPAVTSRIAVLGLVSSPSRVRGYQGRSPGRSPGEALGWFWPLTGVELPFPPKIGKIAALARSSFGVASR